MNVHAAAKAYLTKMLSLAGDGMKVLMVDDETLKVVSLVASMSEVMQRDVYLIERISLPREPLDCLRCICFLRPTKANIQLLGQELRRPNYAAYYVYFSHALAKQLLKQLAECDEFERVVEVQELFADYFPLSPNLFELDISSSYTSRFDLKPDVLNRCIDGITSVLLALKRYPIIRYQNASEPAQQLAQSIRSLIQRETVLFDARQINQPCVLLIIDRRFDTVTPLLTQWTYEAMLHELIGIHQNRVNLAGTRSKLNEVTLCYEFDSFYSTQQFTNFGELGQAVKELVANMQSASKSVNVGQAQTITDLKRILEAYPAYKRASSNVETHVALIGELCRLTDQHSLFELSEIEQELACGDSGGSSMLNKVKACLANPRVQLADALRLVILYTIKYDQKQREICDLCTALIDRGASDADIRLVDQVRLFTRKPDGNTYTGGQANSSGVNAVAALRKRIVQGLVGVENVYTRHQPLLQSILADLYDDKLSESTFPTMLVGQYSQRDKPQQQPKSVIVFVIGGTTYEERRALSTSFGDQSGIVLGGTCVHNSRSFLSEVSSLSSASTGSDDKPNPSFPSRPPVYKKALGSKGPRYSLLQ